MGGEGSCSPSPSAKRTRDATEDEIYLDNFHSHKRYLSELMACSLNGLSVGETLTENLMESPARPDSSLCYNSRDEVAPQYSPMAEDSDDTRCCDSHFSLLTSQPEGSSILASPQSPHRGPKHQASSGPLSGQSYTRRGPDAEARFPSSPNDACHMGDLRRTALLRSVQMRAQPNCSPPPYELLFSGMASVEEGDDHFPCLKNSGNMTDLVDSSE